MSIESPKDVPEVWRSLFERRAIDFTFSALDRQVDGVSINTIIRALTGEGTPTRRVATKIGEALGVSADEFYRTRGELVDDEQPEPFHLPPRASNLTVPERRVVVSMVDAILSAREGATHAEQPAAATSLPSSSEDTQDPQIEVQKTAQQEFAYIDLASLQGYDRLLLQNIAMTRLVLRRPHRPPESDQKLVQLVGEMHDGAINRAQLSIRADSPVKLTAVDYAKQWKQSKAAVMTEFEQILASGLRPELTDTQELDRLMADRESADAALAAVDHRRLDELVPQLADISAQLREYETLRHHVVSEMSAQVRNFAPTADNRHELRSTPHSPSEGVEFGDIEGGSAAMRAVELPAIGLTAALADYWQDAAIVFGTVYDSLPPRQRKELRHDAMRTHNAVIELADAGLARDLPMRRAFENVRASVDESYSQLVDQFDELDQPHESIGIATASLDVAAVSLFSNRERIRRNGLLIDDAVGGWSRLIDGFIGQVNNLLAGPAEIQLQDAQVAAERALGWSLASEENRFKGMHDSR